ncbi:MAG: hypothetical protein K8M05_08520, partial [Deltaproteobacteria bacterium]|nr:hypothetical protein [Kofleriaceae bacterium]
MSATLRSLAESLADALLPLVDAADDQELAVDFLRLLGWEVTAAPASFMALHGPVSLAFENAVGGDDGVEADLTLLIPSVLAAWNAITALATAADLSPEQRAELPGQIIDTLLVDELRSHAPGWYALFDALGIVRVEAVAGAPPRLAYQRKVFDRAKLLEYIDAPIESLKDTYGWGGPTFDGARLNRAAAALARTCGVRVDRYAPPAAIVSALGSFTAGPRAILVERRSPPLAVGIMMIRVPATASAAPGFAVVPTVSSPVGSEIVLIDGRLLIGGDLAAGVGVAVRPGEPLQAVAGAGFRLAYEYHPEQTIALIGDEDGTRVEVLGASAAFEVSGTGEELELVASIEARGLAVVIGGGDTDGFVGTALPASESRIEFPLAVSWSSTTGLTVSGSAQLAARVPLGLRLGPVEVAGVSVELRNAQEGSGPPALALEVGTTLRGEIGPFDFELEGTGVELGIELASGNLGPLDVHVGFRPPVGMRLAFEAGVVKGGGSVRYDRDRREYAGALQLAVAGIHAAATGLLTASAPGIARKYSLVAAIATTFPSIPLGLGFTLHGLGGLLGVHRRIDVEALRASLRGPGVGELFFDVEPARILTDLDSYVPASPGRHVFGPAAKIGWGTPTIVEATVALLLEVPAPVRLALLGNVSAALPTKANPIIELNVDVLGDVDFARKTLAIDATLRDSQVVGFPITGDMALRMGWGDPPSFALSVGGFHSQFRVPPGFPALRPIKIPIGSGDNPRLDITGFLALTSNTAQVGAQVDLYAAAGPLNITGNAGFEALLQFLPFAFQADLWGGVALRRGTTVLAGVHLDGTLRGPTPWHVAGEACLSLWLVDLCVGFSATFGQPRDAELPSREIWPLLEEALEDPRSWSTPLPVGAARAVVTAMPVDGEAATRVDPGAALAVRQKVVPLARTIERFGHVRPSGTDRFELSSASLGTMVIATPEPIHDWFAPAQFEALSDPERLSRPGFEKMVAGATLAADVVTTGAELIAPVEYETFVFPSPTPAPEPYTPTVGQQIAGTDRAANA